ncbi:MAG: Tom37 metaxin N-terminal-like domain-containing protein, partial [Bradymonadaceae bacterium]
MDSLRVFVFSPNFGLPTSGPFALKLECWLRMHQIDYERVYEDNPSKGPKGKNPWVEFDGERLGDTEIIIERLSRKLDLEPGPDLTPRERAVATSTRRMVEEHLHQVFEWELFVHDAGWEVMSDHIDTHFPWGLSAGLKIYLRRHFRKQLYARGINRHAPEQVAKMGREDLDAL